MSEAGEGKIDAKHENETRLSHFYDCLSEGVTHERRPWSSSSRMKPHGHDSVSCNERVKPFKIIWLMWYFERIRLLLTDAWVQQLHDSPEIKAHMLNTHQQNEILRSSVGQPIHACWFSQKYIKTFYYSRLCWMTPFIATNVNFNIFSVPMNIMCRNVWCNVQC